MMSLKKFYSLILALVLLFPMSIKLIDTIYHSSHHHYHTSNEILNGLEIEEGLTHFHDSCPIPHFELSIFSNQIEIILSFDRHVISTFLSFYESFIYIQGPYFNNPLRGPPSFNFFSYDY
jgi:hypothetical protein